MHDIFLQLNPDLMTISKLIFFLSKYLIKNVMIIANQFVEKLVEIRGKISSSHSIYISPENILDVALYIAESTINLALCANESGDFLSGFHSFITYCKTRAPPCPLIDAWRSKLRTKLLVNSNRAPRVPPEKLLIIYDGFRQRSTTLYGADRLANDRKRG